MTLTNPPNEVYPSRRSQIVAYHNLQTKPANWLAWEMGCGKTKPVIDSIRALPHFKLGLILCPKSVIAVWAAEFNKHTPPPSWWVHSLGVRDVYHGPITRVRAGLVLDPSGVSAPKRVHEIQKYQRIAEFNELPVVIVLNYEILNRKAMYDFLAKLRFDVLVCDESHYIKAPNGKTSKAVAELGKHATKRIALTGTPMGQGPIDAFAQCRFLDPSIFGPYVTRFRAEYPFERHVKLDFDGRYLTVAGDYSITQQCSKTKTAGRFWNGKCWNYRCDLASVKALCDMFTHDQYGKPVPICATEAFKAAAVNVGYPEGIERLRLVDLTAIEKRFQEKIAPIFHRVEAKDELDLPEYQDQDIVVALCDEARHVYRQMHRDLVADVQGGTLSAANVLARVVRLQQITSGCIPVEHDPGREEMVRVDDAKSEALRTILEGLPDGEPVVVFCRFISDLEEVERVAELVNRGCVQLSGKVNAIGAKWSDDPETVAGQATVAAVQIKAGGVGVDLTRARYVVFFSLSYSLTEYQQAAKRVHRHGQHRNVTIYHLVARDTIDGQIYRALAAKEEVVTRILGGMRDA